MLPTSITAVERLQAWLDNWQRKILVKTKICWERVFLFLMKMSVWSECIYRWALSLTKEPNLGEDVAATENPRLPLNGEEISMHLLFHRKVSWQWRSNRKDCLTIKNMCLAMLLVSQRYRITHPIHPIHPSIRHLAFSVLNLSIDLNCLNCLNCQLSQL